MSGRATRFALATVLSLAAIGHALTAIAQSSATSDIDGLFDVGGHSLYLDCQGTGLPTLV